MKNVRSYGKNNTQNKHKKIKGYEDRKEKLENREALSIWKLKWIKMIVFPRIIFMKRLRIIL